MSNSDISVKQLTPYIGAEISGIDLSKPLDAGTVRQLQDAFHDNLVIFFRDQEISHEQLIRFGRYFGELYVHPAAAAAAAQKKEQAAGAAPAKDAPVNPYISMIDGHPEIIKVYADEHSKQVAGETWHADVSSEEKPPLGSILRIVELPPVGGDTLFASMYAAFDALSDDMKKFLLPLTAIHDGMKVYGQRSAFVPGKTYPRSEHPVVRTHPGTGKKALYVSTTFTTRIVQLSESESDAVLRLLFQHLEQPLFQCRFRWQKNSVAFWDNRCAQHQAQWDYFPQKRMGYRIQLVGDRPFFRR